MNAKTRKISPAMARQLTAIGGGLKTKWTRTIGALVARGLVDQQMTLCLPGEPVVQIYRPTKAGREWLAERADVAKADEQLFAWLDRRIGLTAQQAYTADLIEAYRIDSHNEWCENACATDAERIECDHETALDNEATRVADLYHRTGLADNHDEQFVTRHADCCPTTALAVAHDHRLALEFNADSDALFYQFGEDLILWDDRNGMRWPAIMLALKGAGYQVTREDVGGGVTCVYAQGRHFRAEVNKFGVGREGDGERDHVETMVDYPTGDESGATMGDMLRMVAELFDSETCGACGADLHARGLDNDADVTAHYATPFHTVIITWTCSAPCAAEVKALRTTDGNTLTDMAVMCLRFRLSVDEALAEFAVRECNPEVHTPQLPGCMCALLGDGPIDGAE